VGHCINAILLIEMLQSLFSFLIISDVSHPDLHFTNSNMFESPTLSTVRRARKPRSEVSRTGVISYFIDAEGCGEIAADCDIEDPHLVELAKTFAEVISIESKTADERSRCHRAVTSAQAKGRNGSFATKFYECKDREKLMQRVNGESSYSVVTKAEPTLCLTRALAKKRSLSRLLQRPPRNGTQFGYKEIKQRISAASTVGDLAQLADLLALQKSLFPRTSDTAVTEPSKPSENEEDPEDFAQTAPEAGYMPDDGFSEI
jgi:hypothetical protein